jgi:hypothetical protein
LFENIYIDNVFKKSYVIAMRHAFRYDAGQFAGHVGVAKLTAGPGGRSECVLNINRHDLETAEMC